MTPYPAPQPVPPVPGPVPPGPVAPQPQGIQPLPGQQPAQPQPGPQPLVPQPPAGPQAFPPVPQSAQPAQAAQPAPPWPQQGGFPPPAGPTGPAGPTAPAGTPDWEALAEQNEKAAKRGRRNKLIGAATAVVLLAAAGGGFWFYQHSKNDKKTTQSSGPSSPTTPGSPGPSSPSSAPPVKGIDSPPTVGSVPAKTGPAALNLGADAKPGTMAGFSGQVLKLPSGQDSFASTTTQVVDVSKSFTVSARVLVDLPNGNRSAVSQGDGPYYAWSLGRANNNGHDQWYFKVQVPGGGSAIAWSKGDATVNQWVLLTGVYDDPSGQLTLYVNGAPQSSAKSAGVQPSGTNSLQVGRLSSNSQWADPWHGAVADIQAWGQVLPEADIVKIVAGPSSPPSVPPTGAWLSG
ncbi:concanavalin A-like lectin/glucanase superfamily protein [Streptomyces sp. 1114.5]|uniref:LamG domain-containing protein n=1 Tax=Streptomyces sp. 1114.5 TaxID=1938830 RepID=UPI000EB16486|nr:LamG domain-containing protein [Streptomyces sp. 1114.5]RKT15981.1 concanavalin A-like lectin/glucanase superfamily protein [Streptomyces sp. 1114.5]